MIELLTRDIYFPDVDEATPEGIVAIGGNLDPERLIRAYTEGIFPWYSDDQPILWWSPDPRGIIPLDSIHAGRTLQKILKQKRFDIRIDSAFEQVIRACAIRPDGNESGWVTDEMIDAYITLHSLGYAHSVETWREGRLVGGVYGVAINGFFAGESMFYHESNASKIALIKLTEHLKKRGFHLLDCQMMTDVTKKIGAIEIRRKMYLRLLAQALKKPCTF